MTHHGWAARCPGLATSQQQRTAGKVISEATQTCPGLAAPQHQDANGPLERRSTKQHRLVRASPLLNTRKSMTRWKGDQRSYTDITPGQASENQRRGQVASIKLP